MLLLGLGGAVGCSAYSTFKDLPINCSVEDKYDFDPITAGFACYRDSTPDGGANAATQAIDGGGLCGTQSAELLTSWHNNDWGSTCNGSNFGPLDRSTYEGVSFWARAPGSTSNGFTISLYDANTTDTGSGGNCKIYNAVDGGIPNGIVSGWVDPVTGQVTSGAAVATRLPDECGNNRGNGYDLAMAVTSEWAFYTIPWYRFTQWPYPNRVPNPLLTETGTVPVPGTGLLTNKLFSLAIRPPKEVPLELWIAKLSFYRKKVPGQTAGADAAAGSGGSGGSTGGTGGAPAGTGGSSGSTPSDGVACPLPTQALITDFTNSPEDGGTTDSTTLVVGEHAYPTSGQYMVTSDVSQGNWHISGNLGDYSGFGLDLLNCSRIDASAYRGIQFTISGSVPQGNIVTFGVGTLNNAIRSDWLISHGDATAKAGDPGRCLPTSGSSRYSQSTCADAKKDIPVTAVPTPVKVLWSDFTGGKPEPGVTASDIISIYWYFPNPTGVGTASVVPYPADIVIDDLQFITP